MKQFCESFRLSSGDPARHRSMTVAAQNPVLCSNLELFIPRFDAWGYEGKLVVT